VRRILIICVTAVCIAGSTAGCVRQGVVTISATPIPVATSNLSGIGFAGDPVMTVEPRTAYRIGVDGNFPPFAAYDAGKRQFSGFDIAVMQAIADKAGLNVEYFDAGANRLLSGVLNCTYDAGVSAIAITDQLRQQMAFSDPYLNVGQVIVVKKGNLVITGRDSLTGMTVGVLNGSPSASAVQNTPGVNMVAYPTFDLAFKDVITGNIDAVVASKPRALSYTSIPANKLKIVSDEFGTEDYGIAICPQDAELAEKINDGLAAIKANGTLDKLTRNWLKNSAIR